MNAGTRRSPVRDISALTIRDAEEAGGKGANMGELVAAGLPVPPGFVLMRDCYLDSMRAGGVDAELAALHRDALARVADTARLGELCDRMQALVRTAGVDEPTRSLTLDAYHALGPGAVVAVRSSATGEDGADASFAGMNATLTNVTGDDGLLAAVTRCWMSLFSPRVITYRASRGFLGEPAMAVVVQQMIESDKSGVAFTADPSTGARDRVVIEAAFGLGEVVVSGEVEPDTYLVSKETLQPIDIRVGHQDFKIVRGPDGHDTTVPLDEEQASARVLDDDELRSIAELAIATERHNGCPQDTEWAISDGATYLVQARPITTLGHTDAARGGRARGAGTRAGRGAGHRVRKGPGAADPGRGPPAAGGRDPGGPDDQSGLAADDPARGRAGHRLRRDDLPRGDRGARAGRSVHRRHPERDPGPARRHHRHRRRRPR